MQVSVDRDRCCSSGMCVTNAPEIFDQDDRDGLVLLRQTSFRPDQFADLRLATELCPGGAISLTESDAISLTEGSAISATESDAISATEGGA